MVEYVDAKVLAARGSEIEKSFRVADLPRLQEFAVDTDARARMLTSFRLVDGICGVAGEVAANLRATCQRCLRPVDLKIEDRFHVMLVGSEEEMSTLPESQDSIIAEPERFDLSWFAEEQLLLAMPLVPLHASIDDCGVPSPEPESPPSEVQTPFAQLRELMKKQ
jgi:uncharacterized protein